MKLPPIVLALALFCGACGTPTANTPAPVQNSPQTTVALTVKTVDDTANAGVQTIITLRNAGKVSAGDTTTVENWLKLVFNTDKGINAILTNGQPWATQRIQILTLLGTVTAPTIAATADPGARALIASIMTFVNQIKVGLAQ